MLRQRYNEKRKRVEYALVSKNGKKILQWFGVKKPNEDRVNYHKHQS